MVCGVCELQGIKWVEFCSSEPDGDGFNCVLRSGGEEMRTRVSRAVMREFCEIGIRQLAELDAAEAGKVVPIRFTG